MYTGYKKIGIALAMCLPLLSWSCDNRSEDIPSSDNAGKSDVALNVNVLGLNGTRSVITGTTLPDSCAYSVYAYDGDSKSFLYHGNGVNVRYRGGVSVMDSVVIIPEAVNVPVYAVYPYIGRLDGDGFRVETKTQTDYLRGCCVGADGNMSYATVENPTVNITFDHILSRITLNIRKDKSVEQSYKFSDISLGGDSEGSYRSAYFRLVDNKFEAEGSYDDYYNVVGELKDGKYYIGTADDVVTVDFLVIPSSTMWYVRIPGFDPQWVELPKRTFESGKQYVYDCVIKKDATLSISECIIKPWDKTEMPEVEIY